MIYSWLGKCVYDMQKITERKLHETILTFERNKAFKFKRNNTLDNGCENFSLLVYQE